MVTLTLGDVTFGAYEIPERIPFGTEQALVIHRLVGGVRQIDAMGAVPTALSWSGWLTGLNALARAQQLEAMAQAGQAVALTWDALSYSVLIARVDCDYRLPWRIAYSITCEPVADNSAPVSLVYDNDVDQLVSDDMATAGTLSAGIGDATLIADIATVTSQIGALTPLSTASVASIRAVGQAISAAQAQATAVRAGTGVTIGAAGGSFNTTPDGLASFTSALSNAAAASQSASSIVVTGALLSRISTNATADLSGVNTVTAIGGDLFTIAAQQYGDARLWTVIANANGLSDPMISGQVTLVIPPKPSVASGGILNA
jgi:nucleoid-associated protein YgaU